jgi:hypothetical protein
LVVLALADISLRLVELPIRSGAVAYWFKGMKYRTVDVRRRQVLGVWIASSFILLLATTVSLNAVTEIDQKNRDLQQSLTIASQPISTPVDTTEPGLWVTGDSVILGIRSEIEDKHPIALINARVGRQAPELLDVMKADGPKVLNSTVVFNLGNNNALTREQVIEIFEAVKSAPKAIVVNTAVPRPWKEANNALISELAASYSNISVIPWDQISQGRTEYFAPDGVHLVPAGVRAYVAAIETQL